MALNGTATILFLLLKTLDKYEYLSEFYYQLFQIFKEQEIQKPLKIKHTLFSGG
tara:strand:- start:83 stop:244 length:162 start_codon:yes stop_codon:yes gene_type:complete